MRVLAISAILCLPAGSWAQSGELKTVEQVLDRYKQALGGEEVIRQVRWETRHGEVENPRQKGNITFVSYAEPFKNANKVRLPDGKEIQSGFDGEISWAITPQGATIDKTVPVESNRRDADLQYALHQPDYFAKLELAGITEFDGRRCYWLHGTTHWGKDNNQFYDVETGLLAGYRFESDSAGSKAVTTLLFQDYKKFGGPLVATSVISRTGGNSQTVKFTSVSYEPLNDSVFELPEAIKALLKPSK